MSFNEDVDLRVLEARAGKRVPLRQRVNWRSIKEVSSTIRFGDQRRRLGEESKQVSPSPAPLGRDKGKMEGGAVIHHWIGRVQGRPLNPGGEMKTGWWMLVFEYGKSENSSCTIDCQRRWDGSNLDAGEEFEFLNEQRHPLACDEEYTLLENLIEELTEQGLQWDPRIKPPTAASQQNCFGQMVIRLNAETGAGIPPTLD